MTPSRAASLVAFLCLPLAAAAEDTQNGRMLYETYCGDCHYTRVHERPRDTSRAKNLSDLRDLVAKWAAQTKYRFSLDEKEDVVQYLNASYYRFTK